MAGVNHKIKLLKLIELLRTESDMDHPLTTQKLCSCLEAQGVSCDRRTLSTDIAVLREHGYDIGSKMISHEKGYYLKEGPRDFSVPELKIIIDALQAATFVTEEKTADLVERVARLGGTRKREILKGNIVCFNNRKHTNEGIYRNVDTLERALQAKKQVSFLYFDRDENGQKVYRKEKQRYTVEPMALIFNEDNYYLMTWSSKYGNIVNYRVDRMEDVSVESALVSEHAIMPDTSYADYTEQVFKMYGGPITDVTLDFEDKLIGAVQDKFGEDTKIIRTGKDRCVAAVRLQVSPTFWGWLFQFAGRMHIVAPEELRNEYAEITKRIQS